MGFITNVNTGAAASEARKIRKLLEQQQRQTTAQTAIVEPTYARPPKHIGTVYALWFFLGLFGGHHFYLGKPKWGIVYLLTFGLLGVGWLVDMFTLPTQVRMTNLANGYGATMTPLRLGSS